MLFGAEALAKLRAAHVCVVGVGGVGSWAVEALARSGVGALTLIDFDNVCVSNTNRQACALADTVGRPKVEVLAGRVMAINPLCHVDAVAERFTAATAVRLMSPPFDYVIDATDKMSNKAVLISECLRRGWPVLTVGGAGGKRDATRVRTGDLGEAANDNLLRLVRKKLRRAHGFPNGEGVVFGVRCVYSHERSVFPWSDGTCRAGPEPGTNLTLDDSTGFGTAVFVTGTFGFAAAGDVVRTLVGEAKSHGASNASNLDPGFRS
jgi:tRNA A37 threonylcarbamoyladenosine dehydratase